MAVVAIVAAIALTGSAALSATALSIARRSGRRAVNRDRTLYDAGNRGCALDRGRVTDIVAAAERDVVAGYVTGVGDKALAGCLDLRLVGSQRVAGIAVQDALQPVDSVCGIGVERAAEQLVVKSRAENSALAVIERRAELLIVLD